jgi:hypothetical protein
MRNAGTINLRIASLLLLGIGSAHADITGITPTSQTISMLQWGPYGPGLAITIEGTGAWTAALHPVSPCFYVQMSASSGTAPQTVYATVIFGGGSIGGSTCVFNIEGSGGNPGGPFTFSFNVTNQRYNQPAFFTNALRVPDASLPTGSLPAAEWINYARLTSATSRPGGDWTRPAIGANYVDPDLGATVTRFLQGRYFYSSRPAFNLDGSRMLNAGGVYLRSSGALEYNAIASCEPYWSSRETDKIYCINEGGTTVTAYRLVTPPNATSLGVVYTHPWPIYTGGTPRPSTLDHYAIHDASFRNVCVIDMVSAGNQRWCIDLSSLQLSDIDFVSLDPFPNPGTGYSYAVINGTAPGGTPSVTRSNAGLYIPRYRISDTALENTTPNGIAALESPPSSGDVNATWAYTCGAYGTGNNGRCLGGSHSDVGAALGLSWRVGGFFSQAPNYHQDGSAWVLSQLPNIYPVELGGAFKTRMWTPYEYSACAANGAPVCVIAGTVSAEVTNRRITTCAGSSPVTCTLDAPHGWLVGQAVFVDAIEGMTGVNGRRTLSGVPAGNQIQINVATAGVYSAGTGAVTADTRSAGWDAMGEEVNVVNLATLHVRRLAKTKSVVYNNLSGCIPYDQYNFAGLSGDGRLVNWMSTQGYMDCAGIYLVATGFDVNRWSRARDFSVRDSIFWEAGDTNAVLHWSIPQAVACSARYSTLSDLSGAATVSTNPARQHAAVLSGLSSGTHYYGLIVCDNWHVARFEFDTLPATAATRTLTVQFPQTLGSADVLLAYGITTALGSSVVIPCGAGVCRGAVSGTVGDPLYLRPTYRTGGGASLRVGRLEVY